MKHIWKVALLLVCLCIAAGPVQTAHAQLGGLGKKLKDKAVATATKQAEKKASDAAEKQVEAAAEDAVEKAAASTGAIPTGAGQLGGGQGGSSATVDFRELKAMLPEELAGMTRDEATGEQGAAFGIATSNAQGLYSSSDGPSIEIKLTDLGTARNWAMFGHAWAAAEIDRETGEGYERTFRYQDQYPGYVEYAESDGYKSAQVSVLVGDRFVVEVSGNDVEMAAVEAALAKVDVAKLASMVGEDAAEALEVADFQVLKALLPAQAGGLDRTNTSGQKTNAMNIVTSYAEGIYEGGASRITLKVQDVGTMQGLTALGYGWLVGQSETETDTGYERTGTYNGHPSHERFSSEGGSTSGQLEIFVGKRYLVSAEGSGVTMEQIKATVDAVDVSKLPAN